MRNCHPRRKSKCRCGRAMPQGGAAPHLLIPATHQNQSEQRAAAESGVALTIRAVAQCKCALR